MIFDNYYFEEIVKEKPPKAVVLTTRSFEAVDKIFELPSNGNEA